jgi:hypothetical protein
MPGFLASNSAMMRARSGECRTGRSEGRRGAPAGCRRSAAAGPMSCLCGWQEEVHLVEAAIVLDPRPG